MRSASENSGLRQLFTNKKKGSAVLNNDVTDGDGGKQSEFTFKRKYLNSWENSQLIGNGTIKLSGY